MKKWQERTLFIVGLGIVGVLALALRPAFHADKADNLSDPGNLKHALNPQFDSPQNFSCDYVWDFSNHPSGTVLMGDLKPDAFSLLKGAKWKLRLEVQGNEVKLSHDKPVFHADSPLSQVKAKYLAMFRFPPICRQMPNGDMHMEYNFLIVCEATVTPPFWGKPVHTVAAQNLMVDVTDGCADISTPSYFAGGGEQKVIENGSTPDLPRRFCGSPVEQGLTRILYNFSDIRSNIAAAYQTKHLKQLAQKLISAHADAGKAWPDCWGTDAEAARNLAPKVLPTLLRLQENECYNCRELADFINSPDFSLLFGDSFGDMPLPEERVQKEPIKFRAVSPDELETGDEERKN